MATEITNAVWRVEQGERESFTFPVVDNDDTAFPLAGWSVDAKVKDRPGGTTLYTFPGSAVSVVGNEITLTITAAASTAWTFTHGWFRVVIADDDPDDPQKFRVIAGTLVIDPD